MSKIGIIAGGFKPFTAGHDFLVNKAASENEVVYLFVSTSDRKRKGELPISWNQMKPIWDKLIAPALPKNVKVTYEPNPTTALFNLLETANEDPEDNNTYTFYADDSDISNINNARTAKTLSKLLFNNQLQFSPINREGNVNVSGTLARKAIATADIKQFTSILPAYLQKYSKQILKMLSESKYNLKQIFLNEGIKHIEDLKPSQLLDFLSFWNLDNKQFHVSEKVDGNYFAFGLKDNTFFISSKSNTYTDSSQISNLFFMQDFKRYFELLKNVPLAEIVASLQKKHGFVFNGSIEIEGEAIPSYDHNIVIYDEKKIGDGIFVIFETKFGEQAFHKPEFWKDLASEINKYTSIKVYAVPTVDLSKLKFDNKLILNIRKLIEKNGNILSKPARTQEEKDLKEKLLAAIKEIGKSAKQQALQTKFKSLFGDEYEGLVVAAPNGDLVKIVDKNKFTKRKELNWAFIDKLIDAQNKFKKAIKTDATNLVDALNMWEQDLQTAEEDFNVNKGQITIPKKVADTEKSIDLDKSKINMMKSMLQTTSPEEIRQKFLNRGIVPESVRRTMAYNFLTEGGNVFPESNSTIPNELIETNVNNALKQTGLAPIEFEIIGNKSKPFVGDLDVAIGKEQIESKLGIDETKDFWKELDQFLKSAGARYKINKGLGQFHILVPLIDNNQKQIEALDAQGNGIKEPGLIQIDFFVGNVGWMKKTSSGAPKESAYKAAYRNILIASIFSVVRWTSPKDPTSFYRLLINPRSGMKIAKKKIVPSKGATEKSEVVNEKVISVDPDIVSYILFGKGYTWDQIDSYEKLLALVESPAFRFKKDKNRIMDEFKKALISSKREIPTNLNK